MLYALPSDAPDGSATRAPLISDDVEKIEEWWRGQDATRAPRFDRFPFACGPQVDLTLVRLLSTSAELTPFEGRGAKIVRDVLAALAEPFFTRAVVYFDGPVENADTCGQASSGAGVAIVYLTACAGVPTDATAAHELLHALGAVPDGALHPCPDDAGHTCDTEADLMYPFARGTALADGYALDPGHDDYYAHTGTWVDVQDSPWLRHLDAAPERLSVAVAGRGTVKSDRPGIACPPTCSLDWDGGSQVVLAAQPASGQRFVRWTGGCAGAGQCSLTLAADIAVSALFGPAAVRLTVTIAGRGRVTSRPLGVACPGRCVSLFTSYVPVTLRAEPTNGWRLARWTGACRGRSNVCRLPMPAAASARAVFVRG